tara:strand:- start:1057 stop:1356 length:300 start_codon:yes stop_codon:yes gene_type:complete
MSHWMKRRSKGEAVSSQDKLPDCAKECFNKKKKCRRKSCKYWIKYGEEFNCSLISIALNGSMTLQQTGDRLGISAVRVKQIQDKVIKKIKNDSDADVLN